MNLILFEKHEFGKSIPGHDPRAKHIRRTLKYKEGDSFAAGIINGPIGKATIITLNKQEMVVDFLAKKPRTAAFPLILAVGLTRPQIAKHIFRESASMGIQAIWLYSTELGEKSYIESNFWEEKNYRPQLIKGAGQGCTSNLPEIRFFSSLEKMLKELPLNFDWIALDNGLAEKSLSNYCFKKANVGLVLGSERGLTDRERDLLEEKAISLLKMGERVLRTDTACIAGIAITLSKLRLM